VGVKQMTDDRAEGDLGGVRRTLPALLGGAVDRRPAWTQPVFVGPEGPVTIAHIVAGRSDAVALAPVIRALDLRGVFRQVIVKIGRRAEDLTYDDLLAELGAPGPERTRRVGPARPGVSTGDMVAEVERALLDERPAAVVVVGDDHATLGCTLAAAKLGVSVARIDAGLRSRDWSTADEIHRVLADRLADLLFTHCAGALDNLLAEGIGAERVYHVGSTVIDSLWHAERLARRRRGWESLGVVTGEYVLVSLHRRANADDPQRLAAIVAALVRLAHENGVVLSMHPRLRARLFGSGAISRLAGAGVRCVLSESYLDFVSMLARAGAVLTDSGGVQEEASALGVTCYTLAATTERQVTLTYGTNHVLGDDPAEIRHVRPSPVSQTTAAIPLWDGHAAERIADVLVANFVLRRGYEPPRYDHGLSPHSAAIRSGPSNASA
jgi:UDP-N-acetylglucosamine 2-epimerase (non-hydrolysing)